MTDQRTTCIDCGTELRDGHESVVGMCTPCRWDEEDREEQDDEDDLDDQELDEDCIP